MSSCNRTEYKCSDCIIQYVDSDPKQLTPFNATDPTATIVFKHLFQTLLSFDYNTNELVPVLAKERPTIRPFKGKKIEVIFEIQEAAVWDDGTPITGDDVAFSLKVLKCPFTNNQHLKPDFEIIEDIIINKENRKRFSIIYTEVNMSIENLLTDLIILPKQTYDQEGLLDEYRVDELTNMEESRLQDENLKIFADNYNSPIFQQEIINGSGPYNLSHWEANQRIILTLKEDWWGFALKNKNQWFQTNLNELVFEIYDSPYAGYSSLKKGNIDAMNNIPVKIFANEWSPKKSTYRKEYHVLTAPTFSYDYIGINMRSEKLGDRSVRQALAHLMDIEALIEEACYGFADKVTSFTHPSLTKLANVDLEPYHFNLTFADSLLTMAGWEDSDSNGIREKLILVDSVQQFVELNLTISYNTGNDRRRIACELLQTAAAEVGIKIDIKKMELVNLLENLKKHEFELYIGGWVASPKLANPKTLWHTESANGGSNYVYFGNETSDKIVDKIHTELNPQKQAALYQQLHGLIHEEIPYIFLISQQQRIAVHKKFKNVYGSGFNPGFWAAGFKQQNI